MDAFDIVTDWPHKKETIESYRKRGVPLTNEMSWKMHLEASQAVYDKVINGGLIENIAYDLDKIERAYKK